MEMAKRLVRKDRVEEVSQEHAEQVAYQEDTTTPNEAQKDSPTLPGYHEADDSLETPAADEVTSLHSSSTDSWAHEFPPLNINHEALAHIATHFLPGNHGACTSISPLPRGSFHEILLLSFEDGWSCIGRFCRNVMHLTYMESEVATMELVRGQTSIPVPEVYFANFNENHVVGAPFLLMQRMEGVSLDDVWEELGMENKKGVVEQVARVVHHLAHLRFEAIGALKADGAVGAILERQYGEGSEGIGPFKTIKEYFLGMIEASPSVRCCEECKSLGEEHRALVEKFFNESKPVHRFCDAPFGLMHGDLDLQNLLVDHSDKTQPPRLTAVIDWDSSVTHPLYYILSHPPFLQDRYHSKHSWAENKVLRQHFVHALKAQHPEGSQARKDVYDCFRLREYFLKGFCLRYPGAGKEHEEQLEDLRNFGQILEAGTGSPYEVLFWRPDSDSEYEESESEEESEEDEDEDEDSEGESEESEVGEDEEDEDDDDGYQAVEGSEGGSDLDGESDAGDALG